MRTMEKYYDFTMVADLSILEIYPLYSVPCNTDFIYFINMGDYSSPDMLAHLISKNVNISYLDAQWIDFGDVYV